VMIMMMMMMMMMMLFIVYEYLYNTPYSSERVYTVRHSMFGGYELHKSHAIAQTTARCAVHFRSLESTRSIAV